jgi:hypothetical protein
MGEASLDSLDTTAALARPGALPGVSQGDLVIRSDSGVLRSVVIAAGLCWAVLFVVVGLRYELQIYADGSIFSYSVAVQDAWAFHWHNISDRSFVFLFAMLPAQAYVALTGDASGGIDLYGFLFFAAQLLGLAATFAADRSERRIIFTYACLSTACLCPLVFGFPTEMWMSHALFWPALALCHYAGRGIAGALALFAALLALVLTHEAALVFAVAILSTGLLRGGSDTAFRRAAGLFLVALAIWLAVKLTLPPDDYFADALRRAALNCIDIANLTSPVLLLLLGALAAYAVAILMIRRFAPNEAILYGGWIVAVGLAGYWLWFDHELNADSRYDLRTALLIATPALGLLAVVQALRAEKRLAFPFPLPSGAMTAVTSETAARTIIGAVLLTMLVHAVETAKSLRAWTDYKAAVRALATGTASDPALGDARFVSSDRIGAERNRMAWSSTTHFLSVLVAPGFAPKRLVVDPHASYFWLPCRTATASQEAQRAIPAESRWLVRVHACLHR